MATYFTIQQIKDANKSIGAHWFEPATMRFFHSHVSGPVIANMFVSSEKGPDNIRRYTVRRANDDGSIETVGEFRQYGTKRAAVNAIRRISRDRRVCSDCGIAYTPSENAEQSGYCPACDAKNN